MRTFLAWAALGLAFVFPLLKFSMPDVRGIPSWDMFIDAPEVCKIIKVETPADSGWQALEAGQLYRTSYLTNRQLLFVIRASVLRPSLRGFCLPQTRRVRVSFSCFTQESKWQEGQEEVACH